jgi:hypothetical protein
MTGDWQNDTAILLAALAAAYLAYQAYSSVRGRRSGCTACCTKCRLRPSRGEHTQMIGMEGAQTHSKDA